MKAKPRFDLQFVFRLVLWLSVFFILCHWGYWVPGLVLGCSAVSCEIGRIFEVDPIISFMTGLCLSAFLSFMIWLYIFCTFALDWGVE